MKYIALVDEQLIVYDSDNNPIGKFIPMANIKCEDCNKEELVPYCETPKGWVISVNGFWCESCSMGVKTT